MLLIRHAQSEWNFHYGRTRIDPGIPDPALTELGVQQAEAAAERLAGRDLVAILASPYRRSLQTAAIIATRLDVAVRVDPLVRERCAFSCDQGSVPADLRQHWPDLLFDHLHDCWWGEGIESEASIEARALAFRKEVVAHPDEARTLVVSHWGFVRALTGLEVGNGAIVHYDPVEGRATLEEDATAPLA